MTPERKTWLSLGEAKEVVERSGNPDQLEIRDEAAQLKASEISQKLRDIEFQIAMDGFEAARDLGYGL